MSVVDKIKHYQRNIEKYDDNEDRVCIVALILVFYKILATYTMMQFY